MQYTLTVILLFLVGNIKYFTSKLFFHYTYIPIFNQSLPFQEFLYQTQAQQVSENLGTPLCCDTGTLYIYKGTNSKQIKYLTLFDLKIYRCFVVYLQLFIFNTWQHCSYVKLQLQIVNRGSTRVYEIHDTCALPSTLTLH